MSELNLQAELTRIDRDRAETRKLIAESDKFVAEQRKLMAEAKWFPWAPILVGFIGSGAIGGVVAAIIAKLMH